jgi:CheY-like chemotaxis protein
MDIQMPGMDGLQLSQRLKTDPATWHVVIIAFTAYAMKGDEAKMRAAGCDGYIPKPVDITTFPDYVRAHLKARAMS